MNKDNSAMEKSRSYQMQNLDSEKRSELLNRTAGYGNNFLDSINTRKVSPSKEAIENVSKKLNFFPINSTDPSETIKLLNNTGSPAAMGSAGGRYFGFVIGSSHPAALAASWLTSTWDQNGGLEVTSPVNAEIEKITAKWLKEILPVAKESEAGFVTGVTMAIFSALAAARFAVLKKQGWDVQADGLFGAPPIKIVVGEEVHGSVLKALSMLGLGSERIIKVPVDNQGRMKPDQLPGMDDKTILCLQAGNVNTGSFDLAAEIIPVAKRNGAWVHVDGAFGLWAGTSPQYSHLTKGIEFADSWATDAHKWLNVPYDSGIVFCRNGENLRAAMSMSGAYLDQSGNRIPYQYTPELSRRARAIEIWAALHSLGKNGVIELTDRLCRHAKRFAEGLSDAGFSILNDVVLNQVLVSFGNAEATNKVISEIQNEGTCWCGGTVWQGKTAMRISVQSWATTDEDVEMSLDAIIRIAKKNI